VQRWLIGLALIITAVGIAVPAAAKVVKLEVLRVESPAFEARAFGKVGTYDRIIARATVAVEPTDPRNAVIADIDRAPLNADGLVEGVADVEILAPTIAANGNRLLIYDAVNRGRKLGLGLLNDAPGGGGDFSRDGDGGNGFLMNRGYTIVWSGWQGDVQPGGGRLTLSVPVVPGITGVSREEYIFDHLDNPVTVPLSYPAADLDAAQAKLTVRLREADARATPAGLSFRFDGPDRISITRPDGFDAGAIYEFVYPAKDPKLIGLGLAVTRDIVSFLRHAPADTAGAPNVLAGRIDGSIGFGVSQSGRYLHDFVYYGFNADEDGRVVFDGMMPHLAGGKRTFTNFRFAQPSRSSYQHSDTLFPGADFPFSYPIVSDAQTNRLDGLLLRCLGERNCPKIIKTDTELEFYQGRASLVATHPQGNQLSMPDNVRLFLLSNLQHAAPANATSEVTRTCVYPSNPLYAGPPLRALLVALDAWITRDTLPPDSRYPSVDDGTLVEPTAAAVGFPKIPGVVYRGTMNKAPVLDESVMPPKRGVFYPMFVPKTDADGRNIAGIRLPSLEAPVATHMGWNYRKAGFAPGELCDNTGSMIPFAKTREERLKAGDPRLSLEERYPGPDDRAAAMAKAARQLVQDRLLLEEDAKAFGAAVN
jgi:hypothetical protein